MQALTALTTQAGARRPRALIPVLTIRLTRLVLVTVWEMGSYSSEC